MELIEFSEDNIIKFQFDLKQKDSFEIWKDPTDRGNAFLHCQNLSLRISFFLT